MKRVLSYIPGGTFGGAHNQAVRLAPALVPHGYELVTLLPDEPGDAVGRLRSQNIETHTAPLVRLRASRSPSVHWHQLHAARGQGSRLRTLLRDLQIDLVQIHGITCVDGAAAAMAENLPLVWQLIDTRAPWALRAILMPYVCSSTAVVMTTGNVMQAEFPGLRRLGDRVEAFYPPVDQADFTLDDAKRRIAREHLGIKRGTLAVLCLANMNPQKGLDNVLRATARARITSDFALRIRGSESLAHPGYLQALKKLAEDLGLGSEVVGVLDDTLQPSDFLRAGDIFVLGSRKRSEGIPTVILEAMSAGLPVVATNVGGISEVVSQQYGLVVPPENVPALAAALQRTVALPTSTRLAIGEAARAYAAQRFGLGSFVEAHLQAYRRATTRSSTCADVRGRKRVAS